MPRRRDDEEETKRKEGKEGAAGAHLLFAVDNPNVCAISSALSSGRFAGVCLNENEAKTQEEEEEEGVKRR